MGLAEKYDECNLDLEPESGTDPEIREVIGRIVASCGTSDCFDHVSQVPIPSQESVIEIISVARRILFPGYFTKERIDPVTLEYHIGQRTAALYEAARTQITWAIRHDCHRYDQACSHCTREGTTAAMEFIKALPELRRILATDIRAAFDGDPASPSHDEIIFSYPGLFAVTVYRLANVLYELKVPIIPRIMTEYAHSLTGIDIHPGARIGESFFIDHGTGVVIGQTSVIGDRVRLYQGVTLGALSLSREEVDGLREAKRHPTIEDDVIVYSGATILGGQTVIGARSVIGGSVWLTHSVEPDSKVLLKTPEQVVIDCAACEVKG